MFNILISDSKKIILIAGSSKWTPPDYSFYKNFKKAENALAVAMKLANDKNFTFKIA